MHETDPTYYDAHDMGFIIKDKKQETLEDENMEVDVQVIEYLQLSNVLIKKNLQLSNVKSNNVNNSLLNSMNQEVKLGTASHM